MPPPELWAMDEGRANERTAVLLPWTMLALALLCMVVLVLAYRVGV